MYHENKTFIDHETLQSKGQHKKVAKLTHRDLGNVISKAFLAKTQSDCTKSIEKRKMDHSRILREKEIAEESKEDEEQVEDSSVSRVLGTQKIDDGMVLD